MPPQPPYTPGERGVSSPAPWLEDGASTEGCSPLSSPAATATTSPAQRTLVVASAGPHPTCRGQHGRPGHARLWGDPLEVKRGVLLTVSPPHTSLHGTLHVQKVNGGLMKRIGPGCPGGCPEAGSGRPELHGREGPEGRGTWRLAEGSASPGSLHRPAPAASAGSLEDTACWRLPTPGL